jgi:hypothetical protein
MAVTQMSLPYTFVEGMMDDSKRNISKLTTVEVGGYGYFETHRHARVIRARTAISTPPVIRLSPLAFRCIL